MHICPAHAVSLCCGAPELKFDEPGRRLPTGVMLRFLTVLAEEAIDAPLADTGQHAAAGNLRVW